MAIVAGIDEAGFGPVLGPLVVSCTSVQLPDDLVEANLWHRLRAVCTDKHTGRAGRMVIADSKAVHRPGSGLGPLERPVLVTLAAAGHAVTSWRGLLQLVAPETVPQLDAYPWYHEVDQPLPADLPAGTLVSAVRFVESPPAASPALVRQVVARAEAAVRHWPIAAGLTLRPVLRRSAGLVVALALLVALILAMPGWVQTGWYRFVYPLGALEWPRRVEIEPRTGDERVAVGESVTVALRVTRGLTPTLRPVVHLREPGGQTQVRALQPTAPDCFEATIDAVTTDLEYWFAAGDADTRQTPFTVRVVERPAVVEALAEVQPPPYAEGVAGRWVDLRAGPVDAPVGGSVRVVVRPSKPIPIAVGRAKGAVRFADGEALPLVPAAERSGADDQRLATAWTVDRDRSFTIALTDELGFESVPGGGYQLRAHLDDAPHVRIVEPTATVELTPAGAVELVVRVEDDFGFSGLELSSEVMPRQVVGHEALALPGADEGLRERWQATVSHRWSVAALQVQPGYLVVCQVVAYDNRPTAAGGPQSGVSAPLRLKIVAPLELENRVRDDLHAVEDQVRRVLLQQLELAEQVSAVLTEEEPAPLLPETAAGELASRERQQARLAEQLVGLGRRVTEARQQLERNQVGTAEDRAQLDELADTLSQTAREAMRTAQRHLAGARAAEAGDAQQGELRAAHSAQQQVADALQQVIQAMGRWGDYQSIVTRTRDLRTRLRELQQRTETLGERTLGRSVDALERADAEQLARLERAQQQLAEDHARMAERMAELAERRGGAEADALADALRAGEAHDADRHLREAADALAQNRTAAASLAQRQADQALARMLDALEQREERQLAQLAKRVEEARTRVERLIETQTALQRATVEATQLAAERDAFAALAGPQRTLSEDAQLTARELAEIDRAFEAAAMVDQAAAPMRSAADHLQQAQGEPAQADQDIALQHLAAALADLEALAAEVEEQRWQHSLARVRQVLEEVLGRQHEINAGLDDLHTRVREAGRVQRALAREAARWARQQGEVVDTVGELQPELERVVVYAWALDRVTEWMNAVQARLRSREIDEALLATAGRIERELQTLITALDETQQLPGPDEFVEQSSGDGASGGQQGEASRVVVPTVAELLVVRALQRELNQRTRTFAETFDPQQASEAELVELKQLGEDQRRLEDLTQRLADQARRR